MASGTVAFVAAMTGHRNVAIGTAIVGGILGVGMAFSNALDEEQQRGTLAPAEPVPQVVARSASGVAGTVMAGRLMGRV